MCPSSRQRRAEQRPSIPRYLRAPRPALASAHTSVGRRPSICLAPCLCLKFFTEIRSPPCHFAGLVRCRDPQTQASRIEAACSLQAYKTTLKKANEPRTWRSRPENRTGTPAQRLDSGSLWTSATIELISTVGRVAEGSSCGLLNSAYLTDLPFMVSHPPRPTGQGGCRPGTREAAV